MKIGSGSWDIQRTNSVYNQFATSKTQAQPEEVQKATPQRTTQMQQTAGEVRPQDVLTPKELEALKVLFNYDGGQDFTWYGKNQVRNIHSGFLLDVKG